MDQATADEHEVSFEQMEKILQFQEVTGIEDIDVAKVELSQHNWEVEPAVQSFLSLTDSAQNSPSRTVPRLDSIANQSLSSEPVEQRVGVVPVTSAIAQVGPLSNLLSWAYYILSLPLRITYTSVASLFKFVYRLVFLQPPSSSDPLGDVLLFATEYEAQYGSIHPTFFQGTYKEALNQAKSQLKFMVVYLHCADHQDTEKFCRVVLPDQSIIDFFNSSTIFWACSVATGEGYRVSQTMRENSYPFLAVVVLRENRMTVVGRLEGLVTAEQVYSRIQTIIRNNERFVISARAEREERELNAAIRQQQDVDYQESLKVDREKARKRRQEREKLAMVVEEKRLEEVRLQEEKANRRRLKIEWVDRIPEEPVDGAEGVVHIVCKLPHGARLERRFQETESLDALFYYIFCHPDSPDRFQVTTNFPRQIVPCEPTDSNPKPQTFKEFSLPRRCMLFVADLDA